MITWQDVYQSFLAALMRFLDNRFHPKSDAVLNTLRLELDRANSERSKLLALLVTNTARTAVQVEQETKPEDFKPINSYVPWHIRKSQLESDARKRSQELAREAKSEMSPKLDTIEDIEREISGVSDAS